ncbi:MAG: ribosome maturation factor RimM [Bifidobacterium mongoliense]|nr:ribosome maturation factor RimM [Bifidobacterium mongoliense]
MAGTHDEDPQQPELLRVCRIGRAQGLKGEVTVQSFTDEPDYRYEAGSRLFTRDGATVYTVARSRTFKGRWILLFEGVSNREGAEALAGTELYGQADDPEAMAEEGLWYPKDLIRLEARLASTATPGRPDGAVLGTVVDVDAAPAQALLKIRLSDAFATPESRTALVPFVERIVPTVNLAERYLTIDPPGGLIPGLEPTDR